MNHLSETSLRLVPRQESYEIPTDYREQALWFEEEFGNTLTSHLQNLCRFCDGLPKNQGISYSSIQNGYVLAHYGKFSIYFPTEKIGTKMSAIDWMNNYILEIDNAEVQLETGIQEVQEEVKRRTNERLGTSGQRLVNKLLPNHVPTKQKETTSKHIIIKRVIRIKKR